MLERKQDLKNGALIRGNKSEREEEGEGEIEGGKHCSSSILPHPKGEPAEVGSATPQSSGNICSRFCCGSQADKMMAN